MATCHRCHGTTVATETKGLFLSTWGEALTSSKPGPVLPFQAGKHWTIIKTPTGTVSTVYFSISKQLCSQSAS